MYPRGDQLEGILVCDSLGSRGSGSKGGACLHYFSGAQGGDRGRELSAGLLSHDILDHHLQHEELRLVRTSLWLKMGSGVKVGCVFGWCL